MEALRATLRTFGVLLGLWGALAIAALVTGVIPGLPWSVDPSGEVAEVEVDAGVAEVDASVADDAGVAVVEAPAEPVDGGPPPLPRFRRDRWVVCPEPAIAPSLAALDLAGDARAELVVGCGDRWEVLAIRDGVPVRIARIDAPTVDAESSPGSGPALAVDFDADGTRDLVLPFARYGAGGATRGGGLYVVPRDRFGGFDAPRALAPVAAVAVAAGAIDRDSAIDLAVANLANPFARVPSEVWVFSGGASPARRAVLRTGPGANGVALVDLDLDGRLDAIVTTADEPRVDVFFGDGGGVFPRTHSLAIPGAAGVAVGDVDRDGHPDAIVEAQGLVIVRAREGSAVEATRIDSAPASLRDIEAIDLDGDADAEIVAWDHPRVIVVDIGAESAETRTLLELGAGDFGPRRQRFADLDGEGAPELAFLGVSAIDGTRTLELVIVPGHERGALDVGDRRQVEDAPLMLRVPLPDAQAP